MSHAAKYSADTRALLPKKPLREYSIPEMGRALEQLAPKKDILSGVRLLQSVLKHRGVAGVLEYTEKARKILDEEGKIHEMDFTHRELQAYQPLVQQARRSFIDRRDFLASWGCALSGAAFAAWGGLKTADQLTEYMVGEHEPVEKPMSKHPLRRRFIAGYEFIEAHITGPAELLIGAVLIEECIKHRREVKEDDYEEISNSIAVFSDLIAADQAVLKPQPYAFVAR